MCNKLCRAKNTPQTDDIQRCENSLFAQPGVAAKLICDVVTHTRIVFTERPHVVRFVSRVCVTLFLFTVVIPPQKPNHCALFDNKAHQWN